MSPEGIEDHESYIESLNGDLSDHIQAALRAVTDATRVLRELTSNPVYDVELAEGTEGADADAELATAARALRNVARIVAERNRLMNDQSARPLLGEDGQAGAVHTEPCGECESKGRNCRAHGGRTGIPPVYPAPGSAIPSMPGYVVATCDHRIAAMEWRAGFRTCERCPAERAGGGR